MHFLLAFIMAFFSCAALSAQASTDMPMKQEYATHSFHYDQLSLQYTAKQGLSEFSSFSTSFTNPMGMELDGAWGDVNSAFQTKDFRYGEQWRISDNWLMYGMNTYDTYYGLGAMRKTAVGWTYTWNEKWTLDVSLAAAKYAFDAGMGNRFAVSGSLSYSFSDYISAYLFGNFMPVYDLHSPALIPYMGYSNFGGAVSFSSEYVGIDVGVERYWDPFTGKWMTQPIVMPFVNINGQKMGFDVGRLLQDVFRSVLINASENNALPPPSDFSTKGAPTPVKTALTPGKRF